MSPILFFDVTLDFKIGAARVQPTIKQIPALDAADAERKALATATAKVARSHGATVHVASVQESDG